jgi:hypothetical protein
MVNAIDEFLPDCRHRQHRAKRQKCEEKSHRNLPVS